jgi:hypothetical protein
MSSAKPIPETVGPGSQECHSFTLILGDFGDITEDLVNRVYEAGCEDGSLEIQNGVSSIVFHREADSLRDAALLAIHQVRSCGLEVIRVVPPDADTIKAINVALEAESIPQFAKLVEAIHGA